MLDNNDFFFYILQKTKYERDGRFYLADIIIYTSMYIAVKYISVFNYSSKMAARQH